MTIKYYFRNKVKMLNIPFTGDGLDAFLESRGYDGSAEIDPLDYKVFDILFLEIILMVIAMPNVTEGDMSVSYNRDGLINLYKAECKRLGVEDTISKSTAPKVRDMSFLA